MVIYLVMPTDLTQQAQGGHPVRKNWENLRNITERPKIFIPIVKIMTSNDAFTNLNLSCEHKFEF